MKSIIGFVTISEREQPRISEVFKFKNEIKDYLEIGQGHGLFLKNAIEILDKNVSFTAVDISEVYMNITKPIVNNLVGDEIKVRYIIRNILKINIEKI